MKFFETLQILNSKQIVISFIKKTPTSLFVSAIVKDYLVSLSGDTLQCSCKQGDCAHKEALSLYIQDHQDKYLNNYIYPSQIGRFIEKSSDLKDNRKNLDFKFLTYMTLGGSVFKFNPTEFFYQPITLNFNNNIWSIETTQATILDNTYYLDWELGEFFFLTQEVMNFLERLNSPLQDLLLEKPSSINFKIGEKNSLYLKEINPSLNIQHERNAYKISKGFFHHTFFNFDSIKLSSKETTLLFRKEFYSLNNKTFIDFEHTLYKYFKYKPFIILNEDQLTEFLFFTDQKKITCFFQDKKLFLKKNFSTEQKYNLLDNLKSGYYFGEKEFYLNYFNASSLTKGELYFMYSLFNKEKSFTSEEISFCKNLETHYPLVLDNPELREYQKEGISWLFNLYKKGFGGILADDMGLGKTRQIIFFLQHIEQNSKVLIVVPMSLLYYWKEEIEKYLPHLSLCFYHGHKRILEKSDILVTSYQIFRRDEDKLKKENFHLIIFDEIQFLKNNNSKTSFVAKKFHGIKIGLTGTPFENNLDELLTLFHICVPMLELKKTHSLVLKKIIKPFLLRRTKEEVLKDLPSKQEQYVFLELSDQERYEYNQTLSAFKNILESERNSIEILKVFTKLRLQCLFQKELSTKLEFLKEQINSLGDKKILVFSQFTSFLDILQKHFPQSYRLDGTMSQKKRLENITGFKESSGKQIFFISLKAGGHGLNLQEASYVFLMDPWWNPAVEDQAIGRSHRLGQKNFVHIFKPIIKNSIEEKVLSMKESKKALFSDFLDGFEEKTLFEDFLKEIKDFLLKS